MAADVVSAAIPDMRGVVHAKKTGSGDRRCGFVPGVGVLRMRRGVIGWHAIGNGGAGS